MDDETVDRPKVAGERVDLAPRHEIKHGHLTAHRHTDQRVEGGGERGEGQRTALLRECVVHTAVVHLNQQVGREKRERKSCPLAFGSIVCIDINQKCCALSEYQFLWFQQTYEESRMVCGGLLVKSENFHTLTY